MGMPAIRSATGVARRRPRNSPFSRLHRHAASGRDGFAGGEILEGRLKDVELEEEPPGMFNEGRERVVLPSHLRFAIAA
jgi:hypothetical protein